MTTFRAPTGWASREPGKRPNLKGSWLECAQALLDAGWSKGVLNVSERYWLKIHWATPPWLSDEQLQQIRAIYVSADEELEHVDHIVPLSNPLVSGLHVPWNLQVMTIKGNLSKSNNYWPDMPYNQLVLL